MNIISPTKSEICPIKLSLVRVENVFLLESLARNESHGQTMFVVLLLIGCQISLILSAPLVNEQLRLGCDADFRRIASLPGGHTSIGHCPTTGIAVHHQQVTLVQLFLEQDLLHPLLGLFLEPLIEGVLTWNLTKEVKQAKELKQANEPDQLDERFPPQDEYLGELDRDYVQQALPDLEGGRKIIEQ